MGKYLVDAVVWCKQRLGCHTYHIEMGVVAIILVGTAILTHADWKERVGTLAVILTFGHASVADRLEEGERHRAGQLDEEKKSFAVRCYYKLKRYYYAKEICWTIYFIALGAWSALIGVGLFLLYTPRRNCYRKRHPLKG